MRTAMDITLHIRDGNLPNAIREIGRNVVSSINPLTTIYHDRVRSLGKVQENLISRTNTIEGTDDRRMFINCKIFRRWKRLLVVPCYRVVFVRFILGTQEGRVSLKVLIFFSF